MTTIQPTSPTNEQLSGVLKLIKGADSVELKFTVPDVDRRSAVAALEMDALDPQIRQVMFFGGGGGGSAASVLRHTAPSAGS